VFYGPQGLYGRGREDLVLSGISQHLDGLMERHEERDGRHIRIRKKGILEVNLEERGLRVPAFEVGFPKQKGQGAEADEHDDDLKKNCASFQRYGDARNDWLTPSFRVHGEGTTPRFSGCQSARGGDDAAFGASELLSAVIVELFIYLAGGKDRCE
jgi:hypothetical protein